MIKYLFDDLKQVGKKKYYFKNEEEEIYFSNNYFEIEISYHSGCIDLAINYDGKRDNYFCSDFFSTNEKEKIKVVLNSCYSIEQKCKILSQLLLEISRGKV